MCRFFAFFVNIEIEACLLTLTPSPGGSLEFRARFTILCSLFRIALSISILSQPLSKSHGLEIRRNLQAIGQFL